MKIIQEFGFCQVQLKSGEFVVGLVREVILLQQASLGIQRLDFTGLPEKEKFYVGNQVHTMEQLTEADARTIAQASVNLEYIAKLVCAAFQVTAADLNGDSRPDNIVRARHIAFRLGRDKGFTLNEIGRHFGERGHDTVLAGLESIERRILKEPATRLAMRALRQRLGESDRPYYVPTPKAA